MNFKLLSVLAAGLLIAGPAFSSPITLDFEGASSFASIDGFYNAGGAGPNVDVTFGGDALAISNDALGPYYSNAPTAGTVMAPVGADAAFNRAIGFTSFASFYYSSIDVASVSIFSGLNGAGSLLGTFNLLANAQNGCSDTAFCHWDLVSLNFAGVGRSIQFGGAAGVAGFDNLTVNAVPEPATLGLMLLGLGGLGAAVRRKQAH